LKKRKKKECKVGQRDASTAMLLEGKAQESRDKDTDSSQSYVKVGANLDYAPIGEGEGRPEVSGDEENSVRDARI